jgi:hypothetical protein
VSLLRLERKSACPPLVYKEDEHRPSASCSGFFLLFGLGRWRWRPPPAAPHGRAGSLPGKWCLSVEQLSGHRCHHRRWQAVGRILDRFEIKPFSQPYSLSELAEARHRPYEFDVSSYSVQGIESAQPGRIAAAIRPAGGTAGGLNRPALTSQPLCSFMRTYRRVALLAQTATHGAPTDAAGGEHAPTTSDGEVWWS